MDISLSFLACLSFPAFRIYCNMFHTLCTMSIMWKAVLDLSKDIGLPKSNWWPTYMVSYNLFLMIKLYCLYIILLKLTALLMSTCQNKNNEQKRKGCRNFLTVNFKFLSHWPHLIWCIYSTTCGFFIWRINFVV